MDTPVSPDASDQELVSEVLDGNDAALQLLVSRHIQSVYTFCARYMGNEDEAQDATQETFLKAWRNLSRYDTTKPFRTWLFAIAKNAATDIMRKRKSIVFSKFETDEDTNVLTDTLADTEPLPDEIFSKAATAEVVQHAVASLKPREQTIFTLRYGDGFSFEEIAHILKMSANTVRSVHRRALVALRTILEDQQDIL